MKSSLAASGVGSIDSYCIGLTAGGSRRVGQRYDLKTDPLPQSLGVAANGETTMVADLEGRSGGIRVASAAQSVSLSGASPTLTLSACTAKHNASATFGMRDAPTVVADSLTFAHTGVEPAGALSLVALGHAGGLVAYYESDKLVSTTPTLSMDTVTRVLANDTGGDCADDLVVASAQSSPAVWADGPTGAFIANDTVLSGNPANDVAVGDLDGDGWADFVEVGTNAASILISDQNGGFTEKVGFDQTPKNASAVAVGDLDGDGKNDILIGFASTTGASYWQNQGSDSFVLMSSGLTGTIGATKVAIADLNGDLQNDIIVAIKGTTGSGLRVFINAGGGSFTDMTSAMLGTITLDSDIVDFAITDVDGDCIDDLLVAGTTTAAHLLGISGGSFTDRGPIGSQPAIGVGAADLDGDGIPEVVLLHDDSIDIWSGASS